MSPAAGSDVNTAPGHLGFPHARPRLSLTRDREFKAGGRRLKKKLYQKHQKQYTAPYSAAKSCVLNALAVPSALTQKLPLSLHRQ